MNVGKTSHRRIGNSMIVEEPGADPDLGGDVCRVLTKGLEGDNDNSKTDVFFGRSQAVSTRWSQS